MKLTWWFNNRGPWNDFWWVCFCFLWKLITYVYPLFQHILRHAKIWMLYTYLENLVTTCTEIYWVTRCKRLLEGLNAVNLPCADVDKLATSTAPVIIPASFATAKILTNWNIVWNTNRMRLTPRTILLVSSESNKYT